MKRKAILILALCGLAPILYVVALLFLIVQAFSEAYDKLMNEFVWPVVEAYKQ